MSTLTATEDPWSKVETTTGLSTSGAVVKDAAGIMTKRVAYGYDVFDRRVTKDVDANRDGLDETGERFV